MTWRVEIRPQVEGDVAKAAAWYDEREPGLGADFVEEVIRVWNALAENPLLNSRRHRAKNIRWRLPERFPYRVLFEVDESKHAVIVAAVLHAARSDSHWQKRIST